MSTMRAIAERVAAERGVTLDELRGPSRCKACSQPRQEAMALCYATGKFSNAQIGRFFSRHHTSVIAARTAHRLRTDRNHG